MLKCQFTHTGGSKKLLGGQLKDKTILILGVSYRQDVGDTRYSPVEILVSQFQKDGVVLKMHDPHVDFWKSRMFHWK